MQVIAVTFLITAMAVVADAYPEYSLHFSRDSVRQCGLRRRPTLMRHFAEGQPVYGVQPNQKEIYVIRDSTPYIEVYDSNSFEQKRNISIDRLKGPYDMVQSSYNPISLFIVDWFNANNVTVVRLPEGTIAGWSLQEDVLTTIGLTGSSLYTTENILVTASKSRKLKEFNRNGSLIREVLIKNISSPRQSVQVGPDSYAVCHGYGPPPELHQVCLVNTKGETVKCYGGTRGSGVGQLNIPGRLERTTKNCIMVSDTGNKRVVLLTKTLGYVTDLISSSDLNGPYRLYLDEDRHRLYVADNKVNASGIAVSGRVLVYKI